MVLKNINGRNSTTISPTQRKYKGLDELIYAKFSFLTHAMPLMQVIWWLSFILSSCRTLGEPNCASSGKLLVTIEEWGKHGGS